MEISIMEALHIAHLIGMMNTREECSEVAKKIAGFDPRLIYEEIRAIARDVKKCEDLDERRDWAKNLRRGFFQRTCVLKFHEDILENTLTRVFLNNETYGLNLTSRQVSSN